MLFLLLVFLERLISLRKRRGHLSNEVLYRMQYDNHKYNHNHKNHKYNHNHNSLSDVSLIIERKQKKKRRNLMITINKLLLAKTDKISGREKVSTFKCTGCTETPTWSTRSLIYDHKPNTIKIWFFF